MIENFDWFCMATKKHLAGLPEDHHTLEQWRLLAAVIDAGGFAAAAEALGKSQSAVSYGVQQLQKALGIALLTVQGRRAVLTPEGEILLRRARHLLSESAALQRLATHLLQEHQAVIRLAVDMLYPLGWLFRALEVFSNEFPDTRVELVECVLSGGSEALLHREADLVVTARVPPGFFGEKLHSFELVLVAHPDHPLHRLQRPLSERDLKQHRQIVLRDSGLRQQVDSGWLGAEQRWTVSHLSTSIDALRRGLGFATVPRLQIAQELADGRLKPLPLETPGNGQREVTLYMAFADRDEASVAVRALAERLRAAGND